MKLKLNIKSLNQIAKEFEVGRTWLNDIWLRKYLITKYGYTEFNKIKNSLCSKDASSKTIIDENGNRTEGKIQNTIKELSNDECVSIAKAIYEFRFKISSAIKYDS